MTLGLHLSACCACLPLLVMQMYGCPQAQGRGLVTEQIWDGVHTLDGVMRRFEGQPLCAYSQSTSTEATLDVGTPSGQPTRGASSVKGDIITLRDRSKKVERYVKWLQSVDHPDLRETSPYPGEEVARFSYMPSLGGKSLLITFRSGTSTSSARLEFCRIGLDHEVELRGRIALDASTRDALRREFADPDVYDPWRDIPMELRDQLQGVDGAYWTLETRRDGQYSFAEHWSPDSRYGYEEQVIRGITIPSLSRFVLACRTLLELAGLPLDARDFYPFSPSLLERPSSDEERKTP